MRQLLIHSHWEMRKVARPMRVAHQSVAIARHRRCLHIVTSRKSGNLGAPWSLSTRRICCSSSVPLPRKRDSFWADAVAICSQIWPWLSAIWSSGRLKRSWRLRSCGSVSILAVSTEDPAAGASRVHVEDARHDATYRGRKVRMSTTGHRPPASLGSPRTAAAPASGAARP
jgi:hypothetical protein